MLYLRELKLFVILIFLLFYNIYNNLYFYFTRKTLKYEILKYNKMSTNWFILFFVQKVVKIYNNAVVCSAVCYLKSLNNNRAAIETNHLAYLYLNSWIIYLIFTNRLTMRSFWCPSKPFNLQFFMYPIKYNNFFLLSVQFTLPH